MKSLSQMTDGEYLTWGKNFVSVIESNLADFGVTAAQLSALKASFTELETTMQERVAADEAAAAAVKSQQMSRQSSEPQSSFLKTIIKANPAIPENKKIEAGIEPDKPASRTPPATPINLVVNGYEDGTNQLKWERNGNKPNTQFILEYREAGETEFKYLATTTDTVFSHTNVKPGVQYAYRVKAQRANEQSAYSNVAVVYMA